MTCLAACFGKKAASPSPVTIDIAEGISGIQNIKLYTYSELQFATENFSPANKIGQGGFGSVYKGRLKDDTLAAIKVLSSDSRQGVREFLTEITVISDIEHENLVKLYGCCAEENHRILVYGYLENNSLSQTLLGRGNCNIQFSWKTRSTICIGVARGLAYLHEEVQPHIIHRDIKASNILLDSDLTPKISDFGLAKFFPANLTHISTRVAGTLGYLAPEYAVQGRLTRKADIFSFGILLLEIVSGRRNMNKLLPEEEQYILERAWEMYVRGELATIIDSSLREEFGFDADEACKYLKIAFLCTQEVPKLRPATSTVVKLLTGELDLDETMIPRPSLNSSGPRDQRNTSSDSSSSGNTKTSYATMTFTSLSDRSL